MILRKSLHTAVVAWTCLALSLPQISLANGPTADLKIPIKKQVQNVALTENGQLRGAIVDANGRPIQEAPVVVAHQGKPIAKIRTAEDGTFKVAGLSQGTYQVVSHGGAQNYHVWNHGAAPAGSHHGVIHVANPGVARGQGFGPLMAILSNPLFIGLIVAAAIAIPIAVDDDDAS